MGWQYLGSEGLISAYSLLGEGVNTNSTLVVKNRALNEGEVALQVSTGFCIQFLFFDFWGGDICGWRGQYIRFITKRGVHDKFNVGSQEQVS